jgi:hypothetical protein
VRLEAHEGVEGELDDLVGRLVGDFFDLDAALGAGDEDIAAGGAVGGDGEVELGGAVGFAEVGEADLGALGDVDACGDEEAVDLKAFGAGLGGDHLVGEHELGGFGGGFGGLDELDESGLAAAAGEDLGLDDGELCSCVVGDLGVGVGGFVGGGDDLSGGDGDVEGGEEVAGLVLVDFHRGLRVGG